MAITIKITSTLLGEPVFTGLTMQGQRYIEQGGNDLVEQQQAASIEILK